MINLCHTDAALNANKSLWNTMPASLQPNAAIHSQRSFSAIQFTESHHHLLNDSFCHVSLEL